MGSPEQLAGARRSPAAPDAPPPWAWAVVVLAGLCRCVLLGAVALGSWTVLPVLVGLHTSTVVSGSMTPRFAVGDVVAARPVARSELAVGQVLLFDDPDEPGALRFHRLVAARGDVLTTKGDANAAADSSSVRFAAVQGVGFLRVPWAGLPASWLRTGQTAPLLLAGAGIVALAAGSLLDRRFVVARHVDEHRDRRRRTPRHRGAASAAVVLLVPALLASPVQPARAAFATTVSNGPSIVSGCWDWPLRGTLPASALAYLNFMEASGPTTANRAVPGTSVSTFGTVVRRPGTCSTDASPSATFGTAGASGLVVTTGSSVPDAVTIATWFRSTTASGVIADLGSSADGPTGSVRSSLVLYLNRNGAVTFGAPTAIVAGLTAAVTTCRSPDGYADGAWHVVIATFSTSGGCTVAVDGTRPIGAAAVDAAPVNLQILAGFTGSWRFGYDTISSVYPLQGARPQFTGDLDESQIYTAVLTAAQQQAIVDRRR